MARKARITLAAAALTLAACSGARPVPTKSAKAEVERLEIRDQTFTEFTAAAHVRLPAGAKPVRASWQLMGGDQPTQLAASTQDLAGASPKDGILVVAGTAPYAEADSLAELLERTTPLPVLMRGTIETSDGTTWDFSRAAMVRTPRTPEVSVWHVEAGSIPSEKRIGLVFFVRVENRNPFDIQLEHLVYDLSVNEVKLVEQGAAGNKKRVPPASTAEFEIPMTLDTENFPQVGDYLKPGRTLEYELDGELRLSIGHVPVQLSGPVKIGSGE
jgi:LEA14-like dessication related protein